MLPIALILSVAVSGIAGLVATVIAVLRGKERGLLLALPVLWWLAAAFFTIGELAFPH